MLGNNYKAAVCVEKCFEKGVSEIEELFVYALLLRAGFDVEEEYQNRLDELFLQNPENEDLLELEFLSGDIKETVLYVCSHVDDRNFDKDVFGRILMQNLKAYYESMELRQFAEYTYALWKGIPGAMQHEQPFWTLSYADEPLAWGDEEQSRQLYEAMLRHYEKGEEQRGVLSVLGDEDYPYGMPMNHWYNEEDGKIYFHCGIKGHRLDALQKHNKVSFCVYDSGYQDEGDWALNIKSVIVFGEMVVIDDMEKIVDISTKLSYKFTQDEAYIKSEIEKHAKQTLLLQLTPEHICGKMVKEA